MKHIPVDIQKHSETEMRIQWNGGETTIVPFKRLRFYCRCAGCVDEWTRKRTITLESIRDDIKPVRVEAVGRYAVQIDWNDGHKTGIYPFEVLYEIAIDKEKNHEPKKS